MRFGFCGPAYQPISPLASAEDLLNLYVEKNESPASRTQYSMYGTPGLNLFCTLLAGLSAVRGAYTVNGRCFFVAGTHLFEVSGSGAVTDYGGTGTGNNNIVDDGLPVTMVAGGTASGQYPGQLLIASGGSLTAFNLATNAYAAITGAPSQVLMIDYLDGFFVALLGTNDFQVSAVEDCTNWPGTAISQVSVYSDALIAMIASNRLLWVFGGKRAVAYYNSGAPIFPFDVVNGGFLEVGILAQYSVARVATASGTTILWLGGDERGAKMVYAANGFVPTRVSNSAFEYWMSQQADVSDAVATAIQQEGHNFYFLRFPSANATWVLDVDLGFWHRRSSLVNNVQSAHRMGCHAYAFGKHLIGDAYSGNVYEMSLNFYSEMIGAGNSVPIIRQRIGPTISEEGTWVFLNEFLVEAETGLGPVPPLLDALGNPRDPMMTISFSKDYGKRWGVEFQVPCGQAGDFLRRSVIRRLGKARQWTPKVVMSDPIPWHIVEAEYNPLEQHIPSLKSQWARLGI